ncbi:SAM-dependent methyltransferase [Ideonella livida]|uniref:SAM-dependent methyltransferase n=1 Tax=Ideonella livida TaxID=2707176 RepID=A0A7C9TIX4_9BURK|nr:SAM-dependent methyltransferase [Ideonella livida]NDY91621.1 SAM-dependent methyltransferase [Ideonella livida]
MSSPDRPGTGRLVLVPNTLDLGAAPEPIAQVLPVGVLQRAAGLRHWVVENAKSTRAFLKRCDAVAPLALPLQQLDIQELPRPRKGAAPGADAPQDWERLLAPALAGGEVALQSEAGLPGVADPGAALVMAAHRAGLAVEPLPGPSSLTLAVAASGLNGQRFAFEGYLPQDAAARAQRVKTLEQRSRQEGQTQLVIETPYRNTALLQALVAQLSPGTWLSVAWGLTSAGGGCRTLKVSQWRQLPADQRTLASDLPAVFMWLA